MTNLAEAEDIGLDEEAAAPPPKKSRRLLFIAAGAVVALAVAGGGAALFLTSQAPPPDADPALAAAVPQTFFYDLPEMTVNLSSAGDEEQFLKLSIALELRSEDLVAIVEPRMPRVLDAFQVYLRELRKSDLEGSAGIYRLKEELRRRINLAISPAQVDSILFKEILVQ